MRHGGVLSHELRFRRCHNSEFRASRKEPVRDLFHRPLSSSCDIQPCLRHGKGRSSQCREAEPLGRSEAQSAYSAILCMQVQAAQNFTGKPPISLSRKRLQTVILEMSHKKCDIYFV